VIDYRGYGRSTGVPCFSKMTDDAEAIFNDIPRLAETAGIRAEGIFIMGRSLGSAPALYLASVHTGELEGLLLDSPFADGPGLIHRLGGPRLDAGELPGFVDNLGRMDRCTLPTLIIHGTEDRIIPLSDAKALYAACRSATRQLVEISGAGHNDLLMKGFEKYFSSIRDHIARTSGRLMTRSS
jgi:pimeloyl-ACP methyl ester carboxylesterase